MGSGASFVLYSEYKCAKNRKGKSWKSTLVLEVVFIFYCSPLSELVLWLLPTWKLYSPTGVGVCAGIGSPLSSARAKLDSILLSVVAEGSWLFDMCVLCIMPIKVSKPNYQFCP